MRRLAAAVAWPCAATVARASPVWATPMAVNPISVVARAPFIGLRATMSDTVCRDCGLALTERDATCKGCHRENPNFEFADKMNMRSRSGAPVRRIFKGDWFCGKCKQHNFKTRTTCGECDVSREESGGLEIQESSDSGLSQNKQRPFRIGDWRCEACQNHNYARRLNCMRCGRERTARPGQAPPAAADPDVCLSRGQVTRSTYGGQNLLGYYCKRCQKYNNGHSYQSAIAKCLFCGHDPHTIDQKVGDQGMASLGVIPGMGTSRDLENRAYAAAVAKDDDGDDKGGDARVRGHYADIEAPPPRGNNSQ